jgi:hypothetical protein
VPVYRSVAAIERLLRSHGGVRIAPMQEFDPKTGVLMGVTYCFELIVRGQVFPFQFELPIRVPVKATSRQREQAERTAYRLFFWWLESNLGLVDQGFIDLERVMLAWIAVVGPDGRTTVGNIMLQAIASGNLQAALGDGRSS